MDVGWFEVGCGISLNVFRVSGRERGILVAVDFVEPVGSEIGCLKSGFPIENGGCG